MVVEQPGRIVVVRGGADARRSRSSTSARSVEYGGEQGLLSVAFPPDYQQSRAVLRLLHGPRRRDNRIVEYRRTSADRADASTARVVLTMPNLEANHNGGLPALRPGRAALRGYGRRRRRRTTSTGQRQRPEPRLAARQDPADRPGVRAGGRVPDPASNPFSEPRGGARRDLRLRPAQPVAVLVRPPDRRPVDRRRRPGPGRGDRLRPPRPRRRARTTAGARGRAAGGTSTSPPRARCSRSSAPHSAGLLLDHRRLRRARRVGPEPRRALCLLRRLRLAHHRVRDPPRRPPDLRAACSVGLASQALAGRVVRRGQTAGACTWCRCSGPVYRFAAPS
jgi:hypothetical protein